MIRTTTISEENLKFIAKDIGKRLMPYFTPEERLEGLTIEERLMGLTPEARLKAIEKLLMGLTPEERLIGLTPAEERQLFEWLAKKYGGNGEASTMASGQYAPTEL
ncbi:MAG: hypothetical protein ACPGWR_12305 [Ardenticatenaceae bacterium]